MANYINKYIDMTAYNADSTKQYPNTAKVESENRVLFQRSDPADLRRVICTYNVTSTSSATILLTSATSISKQIIDGVEQSSVVTQYTFNTTGEHIVKYELANNQIGNSAFYDCRNLTSITIPNSVTTIVTYAFSKCTKLTSITIPDSVTSIGTYAFQQCITLANVTIGNGVIGERAFDDCTNLTTVTIGNGVTSIGNSAFNKCTKLTTVTIGNGVTSIDSYAFFNCSSLTSVTVESTTPPTLGSRVFDNNASSRKIYVPAASVSTYQSASGWSTYASAIEAIQ